MGRTQPIQCQGSSWYSGKALGQHLAAQQCSNSFRSFSAPGPFMPFRLQEQHCLLPCVLCWRQGQALTSMVEKSASHHQT